eukprot:scaffold576_cov260-Pinguiococcus_pyrenoidosus.AAC.104
MHLQRHLLLPPRLRPRSATLPSTLVGAFSHTDLWLYQAYRRRVSMLSSIFSVFFFTRQNRFGRPKRRESNTPACVTRSGTAEKSACAERGATNGACRAGRWELLHFSRRDLSGLRKKTADQEVKEQVTS